MNKSEIIQECIDTVICKTNLTPLAAGSSHEQVITHYATENGARSAVLVLKDMLITELAIEINAAKNMDVRR